MQPSLSAKSNARDLVHKAYRARGHRANNLWLVYSPKTNRDWLLNSDLQYIYWLYFLESDEAVTHFEMLERTSGSPDFLVDYLDRHSEVHFIKTDRSEVPETYCVEGRNLSCKLFDYETLEKVSIEALRWAKPLAFAASIRDEQCTHLMNALAFFFSRTRAGIVGDVISYFEEHDRTEVIGVMIRQHSRGLIRLSLELGPFDLNTRWEASA